MKRHPNNSRPPFWLLRLAAVAATVTVLWVTGNFVFYNNVSGGSIYYTYYQPYTNILKPDNTSETANYTLAMELYENGNYQEAKEALEQAIIEDTDNLGLQFYHAICQLELGNTDFAAAGFKDITIANDPSFSSPAKWYLGLAYLKLNKKKKAQEVFSTLKLSDGPYQKNAAEILGVL